IVDTELEGDVCFGPGIGGDIGLLPIVRHFTTEDLPAAILTAYRVLRRDRIDRLEQFRLLGAYRVGVERGRRLHSDHGEQLKQMVRHMVRYRPGFLLEGPPR